MLNAFRSSFAFGKFQKLPNVVSDGLVYYIDAGDVTSYSGSGSTLNDLAGSALVCSNYIIDHYLLLKFLKTIITPQV